MINSNDLILGVSDSHDSGICVFKDNKIIYAINEERISRIKNQSGFPDLSIINFLDKFNINPEQIKYIAVAGLARISKNIPTNNNLSLNNGKYLLSIKFISFLSKFKFTRIFIKNDIFIFLHRLIFKFILKSQRKKKLLQKLKKHKIFPEYLDIFDHHDCHLVSAYISSPFNESLVFSNDGMGDGISSKVAIISNDRITHLVQNSFYNSLGMIYGYASDLCNYKKNHHNGKTTGLSAHGNFKETEKIFEKVITWDVKKTKYINRVGVFLETIKYLKKNLYNFSKEDIAAGVQKITDKIITKQVSYFYNKFKISNICLVGGLHANVLSNSKILNINRNLKVFVFPNMSDGGLAFGAAGLIHKKYNKFFKKMKINNFYFGDFFSDEEIEKFLQENKIKYRKIENIEKKLAELLSQGNVIARFSGNMEYGPRALGNRSILYNAKDKSVNLWLNKKLKRTETMPFAPIIQYEFAHKYIENLKEEDIISLENMTITMKASDLCHADSAAAVHIDSTLRPQIIKKEYNIKLHKLLQYYYIITGIPLLINTSFNLHEEPIVRTPEEACKAFFQSELDNLALENFLITKEDNKL